MIFEQTFNGLGYSGYAVLNGIPIPLLPSSAAENENIIKSSGSYHNNPAFAVGMFPVKNRRSIPLTFSTFICPKTMPLVKALTYGWRTSGKVMDNVDQVPFGIYPAVGEGYSGVGHVDTLTLTGAPDALVGLNVTMTSWVWTEVKSPQSLQKYGKQVDSYSKEYKPIAGWQTIPYFSVISDKAVPMSWSLTLNNNWSYQAFLAGYNEPPNPALISAGDLDITFNITWLAARNSRPADFGSLQLQIGAPNQIDRIFIDNLVREPQRQFTGIAGPNEPVKWEASYYSRGSIPRSS